MNTQQPSPRAIEEAKKFPNGWVYVIDEAFENAPDVPAEAILGAWQVNSEGNIVGSFVPNPNYINLKKL